MIALNQTNTTIYLPYFEDAARIDIFDENISKILEIDVTGFAKVLPEEIIEEEIPTEEVIPAEPPQRNMFKIMVVVLLVVLIALVAWFLIFTKKKKTK